MTDTYVTGFTYNNNTLSIKQTAGQPDLLVNINTLTGLTINGNITITGQTTTNSLSATTISATTYYNLPQDIFTTGGTYNNTTGIATFTNNSGGTFNVSGFLTGTTDSYTTGYTYSNNTFTLKRNNSLPDLSVSVNTMTGLTINGDLTVTGRTTSGSVSATTMTATTITADNYENLPFTDNQTLELFISGGTEYARLKETISAPSGGTRTFQGNVIVNSGFTASTISATTYYNLPTTIDTFTTGGTYNNTTGIATFTNNTGGTFNVSGFYTGATDSYTTGFTFNSSNYDLTIKRNNSLPDLTVNLGILSSDVTITGGTYNPTTGIAIFTNNTGGTFSVSGFLTGMTDTYVSGFTYSNNNLTIKQTAGQPDLLVNINTLTGLTINGNLTVTGLTTSNAISANTITATTITATDYQNLPFTDNQTIEGFVSGDTTYVRLKEVVSAPSGGTRTFQGNVVVSSGFTANTISATTYYNLPTTIDTFTTGFTYNNNTFTLSRNNGLPNLTATINTLTGLTINGNLTVTGQTISTSLSATTYYNLPLDVYTTGGTYNTSTGIATFTNNTGGTFNVTGFTSPISMSVDYIDFNTAYTGQTLPAGRIQWDNGNGTLVVGLKGGTSNMEIGLENMALCYNDELTTLTAGTIVYVSGSQGNRPAIKRAIGTSDGYSVTTLGVVSESIAPGAEGFVTTFGMVNNLNTTGYSGGTPIWLSPTVSGTFTSVKPKAPQHTVLLGYVVRVHASVGSVFVHVSNGWEIDELHDVRLNGRVPGDLLTYSGYNGSNVWVNSKTLNGSYTITGNTNIGGGLTASTISASTVSGNNLYVTGGTSIFSGNSSSDLVRITQDGSGNAFVVEDVNNPDGTPFVIDTNGNVGMGTLTPQNVLHVKANPSSTGTATIRVESDASTANASISYYSGGVHRWEVGTGISLGAPYEIYDRVAGQTRFSITTSGAAVFSNGNVGIGTTTPTSRLSVLKGTQSDTISVVNSAAWIGGVDVGLAIGQSASAPYGTWLQSIRPSDNATFPLLLNPSGSSVGIGITVPLATLHTRTVAVPSAGETVARFDVSDDTSSYLRIYNSTTVDASFVPTLEGKNSAATVALGFIGNATSDTGNESITLFDSRVGDSAVVTRPLFQWNNFGVTRMSMRADGNLGLGVTNPTEKLVVNGNAVITGSITVTGGTQSLFSGNSSVEMVKIVQAGSGDAFVVQDQANGDPSHFVINASGNTAIGLTQPIGNDKLTVSGNTGIYGTLSVTTVSATTYQNLPKVGFSPINVGVCDTAPTAASTQYYYQTIGEVTATLSKVKLWGFSGSDLVLFGIYRGSLGGSMTLIGQARGTCGLGSNELTLTAETGQNLTITAGEDLVVGYYPDGTSWRTIYDVGISDINFGISNTNNITTMPATPTGTATGIRFACTLY